jgi:hypothetical protein
MNSRETAGKKKKSLKEKLDYCMLIRIFSPTECELIRDADLKKCGLNRMTTVFARARGRVKSVAPTRQ